MSKIISTDAFVSINGNDISDHVKSVTLNYGADAVEQTTMGDGTKKSAGGLKNWSVEIEAYNDYAASQIDSLMFPLVGITFAVIVRPLKTGGVSATNPNYSGNGLLTKYNPIVASVGENVMAPLSIEAAGTLSRLTA